MLRAFEGRSRHRWCVRVLTLFLAVGAFPTRAADQPRQFTSTWTEKIQIKQTVRVVNPFGAVFSRFGGYTGEVEILGTFQRLDLDQPELEVKIARAADGLNVSVGFAGGPDGLADRSAELETRDRVDLVVFVPQKSTLEVQTRAGAIEAEKLQSNVVAHSVKGDIRIRAIQGSVTARTARGRIVATLENGATDEAQELATETGDIEVHVWEDANFKVNLATSGLIGTDFSVEIEHKRREEPNKQAWAIVGRGGPRLKLFSKEGQISLRRLQRGFRADGPARSEHLEEQDPD